MSKLAYKIAFPNNLIETYEFLQFEFNRVLSDDLLRELILELDTNSQRGNYWRALRSRIGDTTQDEWKRLNKLANPAWYFRAFAEQIRQLHKAQEEQRALYDAIQLFRNELTNEFYNYCISRKIPFSKTKISNMSRCRTRPTLPYSATFVLDFAFIDIQASKMVDNIFSYRIMVDGEPQWFELPIVIHQSSKYNPDARISKPKFSKDTYGNYYGVITYVYEEPEVQGENIAAIDLGKVNLYTLAFARPNGEYSECYTHSQYLERLKTKADTLYKERDSLIRKNERVDNLFVSAEYIPQFAIDKWIRRNERIGELTRKISRVKSAISYEMASEISELCIKFECPTLFMEDLSWLESLGGKWNHSDQQSVISEQCELRGLKVYKVDARKTSKEHPVTGELGRVTGRNVEWSTGEVLDRDYTSTLNQVQRRGKRRISKTTRKLEYKEGVNIPRLRDKHEPTPRRTKRKSSNRKLALQRLDAMRNKKLSRTAQIVVVLPRTSDINGDIATWSCVEKSLLAGVNTSLKRRDVHKLEYLRI